ncbi:MAG: GGDEF domain-containing protein [Thermoanaerobaculia bacterium]|nr:GGDEF domain-containing protein [Thermoanaerobaculia bacterium]
MIEDGSLDPNADLPGDVRPSSSLSDALGQNEAAKELVAEAAAELSAINTELKQGLADQKSMPDLEAVIEKSEAVGEKVQEASEKLSSVNLVLQNAVTDRHALQGQLVAVTEQAVADRHAALHDTLTGLPNRTLFNDRLEHGIAHAKRRGWPLAVMFVDLDDFKAINDLHGHDAGDSVLRTIATRLKAATRSDDTVSRVGGDEFLFLLMEVQDENGAASIAKKLLASIQTPCDVNVDQKSICLTVKASVGMAIYPKSGITAEALIKSADAAMYDAKRAGSGYSLAP